MKIPVWLIVILAVALGTVLLLGRQVGTGPDTGADFTQFELRDLGAAPVFAGSTYEGEEVRLSDFRGKILVANSWAVWCPFCKDELPDFARLQREFPNEVAVVAIDRQEPVEKAKGFTDSIGLSDDIIFLLDPQDTFYKSIGGFSMPETLFIDEDGTVRFHKRGPMTFEEMQAVVEQMLGAT